MLCSIAKRVFLFLFFRGSAVYKSTRHRLRNSTWPSTAQDEPREIDDDLQMDYRDFQKQASAVAT